jgi:hypothetical protein
MTDSRIQLEIDTLPAKKTGYRSSASFGKRQEYTDQELNSLYMRFLSMSGFFMQIVTSHSS